MKNVIKLLDEFIEEMDNYFKTMESFEGENDAALMGIVIRDLTTLKVIRKLIEFNNTGSACVVLVRTIVEGMINIEFMRLKGMDEMLEKFRKFEASEAKHDLDYLSSKEVDVSKLDPEEINKQFEENKEEFLRSDGQRWHSWAHTDSDHMLDEILKAGVVNSDNINTIVHTYVQGSRKTHLSPTDIKLYLLGKDVLTTKDVQDRRLAIVVGLSSLIISARSFAQKRGAKELEEKLQSFFKRLDVDDVNDIE